MYSSRQEWSIKQTMNCLRGSFAPYWQSIQRALFPQLEPVLGPLTGKQQQLVQTLEVICIEQWIPRCFRVPGRPRKDRAALARAFVAKAVYDMPTTRVLLDRLVTDVALRRICGWERKSEVPSESVFSRAFVEFSDTQLPQRTHAALIRNTHHDRLVGHLCRDSTAIEAREKPAPKEKTPPLPKRVAMCILMHNFATGLGATNQPCLASVDTQIRVLCPAGHTTRIQKIANTSSSPPRVSSPSARTSC